LAWLIGPVAIIAAVVAALFSARFKPLIGVNDMLKTIFARLREPSSVTAIAVLLGVFGVPLAPEHLTVVLQVGIAIAGALGVALPERAAS
jgi:hypothetical protein